MFEAPVTFDFAPYRLSGVVYGTLLNHRAALARLGDEAERPPYKGAPKAPILYLKPRNTLAFRGESVIVPDDADELEVGASLGIVLARSACRLSTATALDHVAGYTIVCDVSVPHQSFYRPSIRSKVRDGFCPIGPTVVAKERVGDPDELSVRVFIDGRLAHSTTTGDMVRPVAALLADVTEFMTLSAGDVLMLGVAVDAPRARAGQHVAIEIGGLGRLTTAFVRGRS
jgi:5-oxopent-3-ene-1,2,5-tricarboxylate decarboxylase/2-hydroxyhepta-2,4-diene-1,7-dioate isomerase